MTMIGPNQPRQTCPECEGFGLIEKGSRWDWRPDWVSNPTVGEFTRIPVFVICETCGGEGKITKKRLREIQGEVQL